MTATGRYIGFVGHYYLRLGDVVELYVYTAPSPGYPDGYQLGYLSQEKAPYVEAGSGGTWTVSMALDTTLGSPAVCAVTVQATHQVEDSPSAY